MAPLLKMTGISKRFDAVQALFTVDLDVRGGTVHALIGENGAGKSTLMKILSGGLKPDSGTITIDGRPYAPNGPRQARQYGVSMIYQELTLAPHLTVEENITLGFEKHKFGFLQHQWQDAGQALALLGATKIDLGAKVMHLGIAQQQLVEIARCLLLRSRIIVMDEPTSSLSAEDTRNLFAAIHRLKQQGVTIIYISHFLEEIREIADDFTVLRDGQSVAAGAVKEITLAQLITHMVGRPLDAMFPRTEHRIGPVILSVDHISRPPVVHDVSFQLHAGEILGIAGLVGAGRTESMRCLFGLDKAISGIMTMNNEVFDLESQDARRSLDHGMSMVSESRKTEGLATALPIRDNVSFSSLKQFINALGRLKLEKELSAVKDFADRVSLKYVNILDKVSTLSGGNQQKVVLARVLMDGSAILLLDEPTRGIDVKSKVEIYKLIGELAAQGHGIILISSYVPELFGICDSLAVMFRGTLSPVKHISTWTKESVLAWATTGKHKSESESFPS